MTIRTNPELAQLLNAATTQYDQIRVLGTQLTANKRLKAKRHSNAATAQDQVWATGTLFRDCALIGAPVYSGVSMTFYGDTSDLTTATAVDLATGKSVLRIEGGGHWVEGTVGLTGSGADFIVAENPTATNSFAFAPSMRINPTSSLPAGLPDTTAPEVSLASSSTNVTTASTITLTATATDDVGVVTVNFYRDGALIGTKNAAPWTQTDSLTFERNGTVNYTARAYDAANNEGISAPVAVTVNIPEVVETGPATAVGSNFTDVKFENYTGNAQTNVPVTFGHVFKVGALPAANAAVDLVATDNSVVTCQLDVKNFHSDGSVRHAVLSAILPSLPANSTTTFNIRRRAAPPTGTAPTPSSFPWLACTVVLTDTGLATSGPVNGTVYTADAAALLAAGTYETWLSGPVCSEWLLRVPLKDSGGNEHPDMHVRMNIRTYTGQTRAKVDYIVENNWAKEAATPIGTSPWEVVSVNLRLYRVELKAGSTVLFNNASAGYVRTKFSSANAYNNTLTGAPNTSATLTATITVDGVVCPISTTGAQVQTHGALRNVLNTQLAGHATVAIDITNTGNEIKSLTTGVNSSVVITDPGTLFPAVGHTSPYRPVGGNEVIHFPRCRWKKTFWTSNAPSVHIIHNKTYLMESKALPNYDPTLTGDAATITSRANEMSANSGIGANGITKAYMGDVGYAPGIGILPEWTAMYVVSQDRVAKETMLTQADLSGSWPSHWRDYTTDKPILFSDWPYATTSPNSGDSTNSATGLREKLPDMVTYTALPVNRNQPDVAHHPDFCFVPYMVTGDHFYMEELLFYQRFTIIQQNAHANYRNGREALIQANQVRGQGWAIRTLAHTRYILPNNHPAIADIDYQIEANRLWYDNNCVKTNAPYYNPFGYTTFGSAVAYDMGGSTNNGIAAWMEEFLCQALGRALELGLTKFTSLFNFKTKLPVGLMTNSPDYCWQLACVYELRVRDTETSPFYTTWKQMYDGTVDPQVAAAECGSQAMATLLSDLYPGVDPNIGTMTGYPKTIGGYPANMQPALAYAATFNAAGGDNAWLVFDGRADKPNYNTGPQFAIVPRA